MFETLRSFNKGCFCILLSLSHAFKVESVVAIHTIIYANTFGWKKLWLELDSTYIVTIFQTKSLNVPWRWHSAWVDCL